MVASQPDLPVLRSRATRRLLACSSLLLGLVSPLAVHAGKIGFIEDFSLADDRETVLATLIPGTDDYYYFHCLHFQHQQQFADVDAMLVKWNERHGETARLREIRNRQALLTYDDAPRATLAYLQEYLNLRFNHQRRSIDRNRSLPTQLSAELISSERLRDEALKSHPKDLQRFTDAALAWIADQPLSNEQRRELISRLITPDFPNLVELVHQDLAVDRRVNFGNYPIHRQLLREQLDQLLKLRPSLVNEESFVSTYVHKLAPPAVVNLEHDPAEKQAYLDRLSGFANRLPATQNSFKANVLYHQLKLDVQHEKYDRERLLAYLAIPRRGNTVNSRYNSLSQHRNRYAQLDASIAPYLPPINDDRELIQDYLLALLAEENSYQRYLDYLDEDFVKTLFAEAKILNGLGDPERWSSLLTPQQYKQLRERVELQFATSNTQHFTSDSEVAFDVLIKNVPTLIVKVYRINASSYYQDNETHISTAINLDGLVANHEKTHELEHSPFRRVRQRFVFPELKDPGVYIVDFIGGSTSSRALVHKGTLRHVVNTTPIGQLFSVFDENQQHLKDARIWMGGKVYSADEAGHILLPFSTKPQTTSIILMHDDLVSLAKFEHQAEYHAFDVGIHVDREQLRSRQLAPLLIRSGLRLNGEPVSVDLLDEVTLKITATDLDGIPTSSVINDVELSDDEDYVHNFRVPDRLRKLNVELTATLKPLSTSKVKTLQASREFDVNGIDETVSTDDVYLSQTASGYVLETLGKSGEPIANRPVRIQLHHEWFNQPVNVVLRSDENGIIKLGPLDQIRLLETSTLGSDTASHQWALDQASRFNYPPISTVATGQTVEIPYPGDEDFKANEVSLLETRAFVFTTDVSKHLQRKPGRIEVVDLKPGQYQLRLKRLQRNITIEVRDAKAHSNHLIDDYDAVSLTRNQPLHIQSVRVEDGKALVQLANANAHTRVHLYATNFHPLFDPYTLLQPNYLPPPTRYEQPQLPTLYVQGRKIGDEFRYILERRYATKFPGNLLTRPELILNPWDVQDTVTDVEDLEAGQDFDGAAPSESMQEAAESRMDESGSQRFNAANIDFLANGSIVELNLQPNKDGQISLKLDELAGERLLYVVAVDRYNASQTSVVLPTTEREHLDLRMAKNLDLETHYAMGKKITVHEAGETIEIGNIGSGRFQLYDSLHSVYELFLTLQPDSALGKFRFITRWASMSDDEKQQRYSEFACHELNFFIAQRDPEFFDRVVQPHLTHKLHKTFMDDYLLGNDLRDYLSPWNYQQLNTVESILLAQRIEGEMQYTLARLRNRLSLQPEDDKLLDQLFGTAVRNEQLKRESITADFSMNGAARSWSALSQTRAGGRPSGGVPARGTRGRDRRRLAESEELANARPESAALADSIDAFGLEGRRAAQSRRQLYRQVDRTKEWAENNYYRLPIAQQNESLVGVTPFWVAWAEADRDREFRSKHFIQAANNFTEAMLALAVLDLPERSPEHQIDVVEQQIRIVPSSPVIVLHEQIEQAEATDQSSPVLISQNFFSNDERYETRNGQKVDRLVSSEFLYQTVYGCRLVITNPTSAKQSLDVLLQLPVGALPVAKAKRTETKRVTLEPYHTETIEYLFYFPLPGEYQHYPAHVTRDSKLVAAAEPMQFNVVKELTEVDPESWNYVSQEASDQEVLEYLKSKNLQEIDLTLIAFRMGDADFFANSTQVLRQRHAYHHLLWSYAALHNDPLALHEFLEHEPRVANQSGVVLQSSILNIDPVERKTFEHLEYHPLVNARTHTIGETHEILNDRFYAQYMHWLNLLSYIGDVDDQNRLVTVYYLLLQDRIEDAIEQFKQVNPANVATRMQYDYCRAYLSMSVSDVDTARSIAAQYRDYPVDRWRDAFALVRSHVDEIDGKGATAIDSDDALQAQAERAVSEPTFDFVVEGSKIRINHANLAAAEVRYYLMDIELLFSRNPFVQQHEGQFAYIAANHVEALKFSSDSGEFVHELPGELQRQNVLIEVVGAGNRVSKPYYSNGLTVQTFTRYGQLRVLNTESGQPQSTVYCKVYARHKDGSVKFYKDGYTDLRGRFDYASLSTDTLDHVDRFAILVLSEEQGAMVREVAPPKQ